MDDINFLTTLEARLSSPLITASLQPQSKEAAVPAWHFYRSLRISTSTGSVSTDRMVYYSWGSSPYCLPCSIKLSCKGRYLPCLCLSRGHFDLVFSDVTDKHSCLKCFRFTAPRNSQVEQLHTKGKWLSITRREMFLLHYAQLRAQLLWITLKLLLQDYCNCICHSLSHFLLSSQKERRRRSSFTLYHCRNSHYLNQLQPEGWFGPCINVKHKPSTHLWDIKLNLSQDHTDSASPTILNTLRNL